MDFKKLLIIRILLFFFIALFFHFAFSSIVKMTTIQNPIAEENALPGTPGWDQQLWKKNEPLIEGYTSTTSAASEDDLEFHIRMINPPSHYRLDIYRLGWYNGVGARKVTCLPSCLQDKQGLFYPTGTMDPDTGELRNTWPVTDRITIPSDWVSGYYFALPVMTDQKESHEKPIPFIIKASPEKNLQFWLNLLLTLGKLIMSGVERVYIKVRYQKIKKELMKKELIKYPLIDHFLLCLTVLSAASII